MGTSTFSVPKAKVEKTTTVKVGGLRAQWLAYHATVSGERRYAITVIVLRKGQITGLDLTDAPGNEAADRELMTQVVATFAFS